MLADAAPGRHVSAASTRVLRRLCVAQGVAAVVDGAVLATAAVHFVRDVGLPTTVVGSALALGAGCALVLAAPLGVLADRTGLRRAGAAYSSLVAMALAGLALAGTAGAYTAAAMVLGIAQAGLASARHALAAAVVGPGARVRARAQLHAVLNAGLGAGALLGSLVLTLGTGATARAVFACGAVVALGCGVLLLRLPAEGEGAPPPVPGPPPRTALLDERLVVVTLLTAVVQLCMPVLSVILPLWLATRTSAPPWVPGVALGLNTVLVLAAQTRWSARVHDDASAARSAVLAALGLLVAGTLLSTTAGAAPMLAATLALVGVVALTTGEVAAGPAAWHLALRHAPPGREAQYQAVFGMASSLARIVGSTAALAAVLAGGRAGWVGLGVVTAAAAGGLAGVPRVCRRRSPGADRPSATSRPGPRPPARASGRQDLEGRRPRARADEVVDDRGVVPVLGA